MHFHTDHFRDHILSTAQSELGCIKGLSTADVHAIKKAEGSRNSRDAYTSMKGISNMWLTGMYGTEVRQKYGTALRDLISYNEAIVHALVFESDLHLIVLEAKPVQLTNPSAGIDGTNIPETTIALSHRLSINSLQSRINLRIDSTNMHLSDELMDMQRYASQSICPDIVPLRLYTRVCETVVACFIRSESGLFATTSVDVDTTVNAAIEQAQNRTMILMQQLQDTAIKDQKRKRDEEDATLEHGCKKTEYMAQMRAIQREEEIAELKHVTVIQDIKAVINSGNKPNPKPKKEVVLSADIMNGLLSHFTAQPTLDSNSLLWPLPVIVHTILVRLIKEANRMTLIHSESSGIYDSILKITKDVTKLRIVKPTTNQTLGRLLAGSIHTPLKASGVPIMSRISIPMVIKQQEETSTVLAAYIKEHTAALISSLRPNRPYRIISLDTESRAILSQADQSEISHHPSSTGSDGKSYRLLEAVFTEFVWDNANSAYVYVSRNRKQLFVRPPIGETYDVTPHGRLVSDATTLGLTVKDFCSDLTQYMKNVKQHTPSGELLLLCYNLAHEKNVLSSMGITHNFWTGNIHVDDVYTVTRYAESCQQLESLKLEDVWKTVVIDPQRQSPMARQYMHRGGVVQNDDCQTDLCISWHRATTDSRATFEVWAILNGHTIA
jgi:hypothetical protein